MCEDKYLKSHQCTTCGYSHQSEKRVVYHHVTHHKEETEKYFFSNRKMLREVLKCKQCGEIFFVIMSFNIIFSMNGIDEFTKNWKKTE